ncbi:L-prolyl-[peptidyl carrier protein] dehydrogenase [Lentzea atacamensis]|uniref:L-prolyl-[peptidyl carrier protein] dehydrogenase n=1 Tax=Lentzea atacamensis TaxID=531938 RepID=A0A316HTW3_9PSEU|nr:acyl-CoA dehydrogenase family protein [Lentzea atacamensis]PWK84629.1 L-prolyl-[peptidyl carrier protein] dehydrogenase [Lentzea atacamensis]
MEFGQTAAQRDRCRTIRDAGEYDWQRLGELGVLSAAIPVEHGGRGLGALDTALVFEAAGYGCHDTGLIFAAGAHLFAVALPIAAFGSESQKKKLPGLCDGALIGANAMTEPDAGSDIGALKTTAVRNGDGYVLNGMKSFVSNGPIADVYVTYAVTDPTAGHLGTTGFVVDAGTPGLVRSEPFGKLGMNGCAAGTVEFRDCAVPEDAVLGNGSLVFQHGMLWERACLFAIYLGVQDRLIERCIRHVKQRKQFGRRLSDFQSVSNRIVDMRLRLESARLLLYKACWAIDQNDLAVLPAALSKLAVSQAAVQTALDAVELFGGRGYQTGEGIEEHLRDAVGGLIFSGTSDIQRQLAALELGL